MSRVSPIGVKMAWYWGNGQLNCLEGSTLSGWWGGQDAKKDSTNKHRSQGQLWLSPVGPCHQL
jgi:hypothetical protein